MPIAHDNATLERFWAKVDKTESCWLWTACVDQDGYGYFYVAGSILRAHRVAYDLLVGPIPEGLTLDHLCRVRGCVNPAHLEPVTGSENILRGTSPSAENARKTHCKRGHPLSGDNLYIAPRKPPRSVERHCRTCRRDAKRRQM